MKDKAPIIIVSIFFALIIISIIVLYTLYIKTDLFKSNSQIFESQLLNDINVIKDITDLSTEKQYLESLKKQNYRDDTKINLKYKNSKGNVEEFNISSEGVTNNQTNNSYRKINTKYGEQNDNIINIEFLKENEKYGVLFSDIVKKFVNANITNFNDFFRKISINTEFFEKYQIEKKWNLIANQKEKIEEICIDYIKQLDNKQFTKKKNSNITLSNGQSQITTAYTLTLTSEQTKELYLDILNKLDNKQLINEINQTRKQFEETELTFYVLDNKTSRIILKFDGMEIIIDLYDNQIIINYRTETTENLQFIKLDIIKQEDKKYVSYKDSKNNKIEIEFNETQYVSEGESNVKFTFENQYVKRLDVNIKQKLELSNSLLDVTKEFEKVPNINIDNLNTNNLNSVLSSLLQRIDVNINKKNKKINSEILNMWLNQNKKLENTYQEIKKKEITDFNNLFSLYSGSNINKNIIFNMLDLVSKNMDKYERVSADRIIIFIKEGSQNKEKADELKKIIEEAEQNYNIKFKYDAEGKLNGILMEMVKEEE